MDKKNFQFYYGLVITVVGFGVFYRIPQVIQRIEPIDFFSKKILVVKFCLYVLGAMLVIAGSMRIYKNFK